MPSAWPSAAFDLAFGLAFDLARLGLRPPGLGLGCFCLGLVGLRSSLVR